MATANPISEARGSNLDIHLIDSLAWTASAKLGVQVISWGCTLVVARLLSPSDFGVVSMTAIYVGLIALLSEFGIGSAVVNLPDLGETATRQLNMLSALVSIGMFAGVCIVSVPAAAFFHTPELKSIGPVMGLGFPMAALRAVPNAILQRNLRFRALSGIEAAQTLAQMLATVSMAYFGLRFWALVLGSLTGILTGTVLTLVAAPHGFAWPRLKSIRRALGFTRPVLAANLGWYAYSNADFAIAGKVLGKTALGAYSFAWNLATMPGDKIGSLIMRVVPGFFSVHQHDPASLRRYLCKLTQATATVVFPILFGMALLSRDFILLTVGRKWEAAAAPLAFLCLYATMSALTPMLPQILNAVGKPQLGMWSTLPKLAALPLAFIAGSHWGAVGIAAAWAMIYPVTNIPLVWWTFRAIDLRAVEYWRALRGAALAGAAMGLTVLALQLLPQLRSLPLWLGFCLKVAAGALVYCGVLSTMDRQQLSSYASIFHAWRQRRGGAAAAV